jgi:peptidoglycan/LPS O-acetylase OafA/YrhL
MKSIGHQNGIYRPDIDGLRGIAVSAVVIFHAARNLLPSGYFGVDIFFVISGYLIGGIVYRDSLARRFSFAQFYARRAKRILPALFVVVSFVGLLGLFLFTSKELLEFAGQAVLALFGASNFYYLIHSDYFATTSSHEPLLMTWSLGVEEQFYLLFPFAMIAVSYVERYYRLLAVLIIAVASFCLSVIITPHMPIAAFYMLPPRAWELAVGATLAIVHQDMPKTTKMTGLGLETAALVGLVCLIASLVCFDEKMASLGGAAAVPVLATAVLIHTRNSMVNRALLSFAPLIFIGQVSYSWYLWHWPLMAIARRAADFEPSVWQMLAIAAASFVFAWLTLRFVERPFRSSVAKPKVLLIRYAIALAAALALPVAIKATHGLPQRLPAPVQAVERAELEGRGDCLAPFGEAKIPSDDHCAPKGSGIALLGDSHASALGPGLIKAAEAHGVRVLQLSKSSCTPLLGFTSLYEGKPSLAADCRAFMTAAVARIVGDPAITTVIVSSNWPEPDSTRIVSAVSLKEVNASIAIREGLNGLSRALIGAGKKVVIVADVPQLSFSPPDHMVSEALPLRHFIEKMLDADRAPSGRYFTTANIHPGFLLSRTYIANIMLTLPNVHYFDPSSQLCKDGVCIYNSNGIPLYYDAGHLSSAGSKSLNWDFLFPKNRGGQQD